MYPAISGVSFELHEGESLGVIGPNGAGNRLYETTNRLLILDEGKFLSMEKLQDLSNLGLGLIRNCLAR